MNPQTPNSIEEPPEIYPDRPTLYKTLLKQGYYLPAQKATCCTKSYLGRVQRGEVFSMKLEDVKPFLNEKDVKLEKGDLIRILKEKVEEELGFHCSATPDKKWLLDVLNTLDPENKFLLENLPLKERRYGPFPPVSEKIKMILARKESILRKEREQDEFGGGQHKKMKGELGEIPRNGVEKENNKIEAK